MSFFKKLGKKKQPEKSSPIPETPISAPQIIDTTDNGDDEELIAVLTAAIYAYNQSLDIAEEFPSGLRIVSFKERKRLA